MNITEYENIALKTIVNGCLDLVITESDPREYTQCFCNTDVEDIAKRCKITVNQAKGVLGSLIKKGLAYQHDEDYGFMINLTEDGVKVYLGNN